MCLYRLLFATSLTIIFLNTVSAHEVVNNYPRVKDSVVVVTASHATPRKSSRGSGVVVGANAVVTNCHILFPESHRITKPTRVTVEQILSSGRSRDIHKEIRYPLHAELLREAQVRDLCLLYVEALSQDPAAVPIKLGSTRTLLKGDAISALGSPNFRDHTYTIGTVSNIPPHYEQLHKRWRELADVGIFAPSCSQYYFGKRSIALFQFDAATWWGSSGGGVFDKDARLLGIATQKVLGKVGKVSLPVEGGSADVDVQVPVEGVSFAVPVEWVEDLISNSDDYYKSLARREARKGNAEVARARARRIVRVGLRVKTLIRVGVKIAELNDPEGARISFREATIAATQSKDVAARAVRLTEVAGAQTQSRFLRDSGQTLNAATEWAKQITRTSRRERTLVDILGTYMDLGDRLTAKRILATLSLPRHRVGALVRMAEVIGRKGNKESAKSVLAEARDVAEGLENEEEKWEIFADVGWAQVGMGLWRDAKDIARRMSQVVEGVEVMVGVASWQREKGYAGWSVTLAEAKEQAEGMVDARERDSLLQEIAELYLEWGDVAGARQTVSLMDVPESVGSVLIQVAQEQMAGGENAGALKTLQEAKQAISRIESHSDGRRRDRALQLIVELEFDGSYKERAKATLQSIRGLAVRFEAWRRMADIEARGGHFVAARVALDRARSVVERIGDVEQRVELMLELADAYVDAEDTGKANDVIKEAAAIAKGLGIGVQYIDALEAIIATQKAIGNNRDRLRAMIEELNGLCPPPKLGA